MLETTRFNSFIIPPDRLAKLDGMRPLRVHNLSVNGPKVGFLELVAVVSDGRQMIRENVEGNFDAKAIQGDHVLAVALGAIENRLRILAKDLEKRENTCLAPKSNQIEELLAVCNDKLIWDSIKHACDFDPTGNLAYIVGSYILENQEKLHAVQGIRQISQWEENLKPDEIAKNLFNVSKKCSNRHASLGLGNVESKVGDLNKAMFLYLEAAQLGSADAYEKLASAYHLHSNKELEEHALSQAAALGSNRAQLHLGMKFIRSVFEDEKSDGLRMLKQASEAGNLHASAYLATAYLNGDFIPKSIKQAEIYGGVAAIQGDIASALNLAGTMQAKSNYDQAAIYICIAEMHMTNQHNNAIIRGYGVNDAYFRGTYQKIRSELSTHKEVNWSEARDVAAGMLRARD